MERYSERRVLELYRQALDNQDILGSHYVPSLKKIFGEKEWSLMRETCTTDRALANEVVRRVQQKDTIPCYLDFSKAVFSDRSVRSNAETCLPFASNLHATRATPRESHIVLRTPLSSPLAVWLLTSEDQYRSAYQLLHRAGYTTCGDGLLHRAGDVQYQVLSSKTLTVCLGTVPGNAIFTVASFLNSIQPKPLLSLLTGTCSAPLSVARGGDVVIVGRKKETLSIPAELENAMALWRLQGREKWREHCVSPTVDKSIYLQALWLARLHIELKSPPEERTSWYQELGLDNDQPVTESAAFTRNIPDPDQLWRLLKASGSWSYSDGQLPYAPSGQMLAMARASMLHSSSTFPVPPSNPEPQVVISPGAKRFLTEGAKVVCSPEATGFYLQAPKNDYIAIMGVSHVSVDCDEYESSGATAAGLNAMAFASQALECIAERLRDKREY